MHQLRRREEVTHKVVDGQDVVVVRLAHAVWLPKVTHRPHALAVVDGFVERGVDVLVVGQLPTSSALAEQTYPLPRHAAGKLRLGPLRRRQALVRTAVYREEAPQVGRTHLQASHAGSSAHEASLHRIRLRRGVVLRLTQCLQARRVRVDAGLSVKHAHPTG